MTSEGFPDGLKLPPEWVEQLADEPELLAELADDEVFHKTLECEPEAEGFFFVMTSGPLSEVERAHLRFLRDRRASVTETDLNDTSDEGH